MRKRLLSLILAMAAVFFTGCGPSAPAQSQQIVRQITVTCEQDGSVVRRVYHSPEKMRQILNSLRSLGQKSTPQVDPDTIQGGTYSITLTHTDGSDRIYQAKPDRFIRQGRDPWQQADPKGIENLTVLLQTLPGDEDTPIM